MTVITVTARRTDADGTWIDVGSHTGRIMTMVMADGQPLSISVQDDGLTVITPLTQAAPRSAAEAEAGRETDKPTSEHSPAQDGGKITSKATLLTAFKTRLNQNLHARKENQ